MLKSSVSMLSSMPNSSESMLSSKASSPESILSAKPIPSESISSSKSASSDSRLSSKPKSPDNIFSSNVSSSGGIPVSASIPLSGSPVSLDEVSVVFLPIDANMASMSSMLIALLCSPAEIFSDTELSSASPPWAVCETDSASSSLSPPINDFKRLSKYSSLELMISPQLNFL